MEDVGIEAKEATVREVAKLLPLPELLASIATIKSDYLSRQQANDSQLSTMVAEQVEQARAGIDALSLSQKTIHQLRENLSIEKLCQECQTLIENHDQIKLLSNARNNLNTTLKDVGGMMSISVEAAAARDSLSDDRELIHTFEKLTALDGKRRFALAAAASHKEEINFEDTCKGFLDVAKVLCTGSELSTHILSSQGLAKKEAVRQTVNVIFEDPGVQELVAKLYQKGLVTEYLVETFSDYFTDVKLFIEERSFRRFVEACLEETIVVYVDHLLMLRTYVKEETIERMRLDEDVLTDFFREYINVTKVGSHLRELASAESVDSFTLIYTNILEHQPDCPPEVVEKLVALREGIPRKDAKEVAQDCKGIYENSLVDGNPPKKGFVFGRVKSLAPKSMWRR